MKSAWTRIRTECMLIDATERVMKRRRKGRRRRWIDGNYEKSNRIAGNMTA